MSWLGKILTFLVLIGAVVWASFTVNVYVTRTNWKVRAEAYETAYKASEANRTKEARDYEANREAAVRMYLAAQTRADDLKKALDDLETSGRKTDDDYKKLKKDFDEADVQAKILLASVKTIQDELKLTRERSSALEDERVKLVIAKEAADRERLRAENDAKLARSIADENAKKVENLTALVTELRQTGGGNSTATVLRNIEKPPAPLPENIRGTVTNVNGDFVQISIGIDAGLEPGSRIDVYRETNGGKYLGTLVVTKSIYPKEAVAEFRPARGVPLSQLRPDELPRKGDTVGQLTVGPR
jgi:hypothetical protein